MNKSNNDIMWDCITDIFNGGYSTSTYLNVDAFVYYYKEHEGEEIEYNFSHDNWLAILCWLHKFKMYKGNVPLFGHHTKHPMRFIMFLWMKSNWFYPLRLITMFEMILGSTIFARKTESGSLHTSGILLDYYLCHSYDMKVMMKMLTFIVKHRTSWGTWDYIFFKYHGNSNHYNHKVWITYKMMISK